MKVTLETLAAVCRMAKHLANADGDVKDEEIKPLFDFFQTFEGMDSDTLRQIVNHSINGMDDDRAIELISQLDRDAKEQVSYMFSQIVCADEELTDEETNLYIEICDKCDLPGPDGYDDDDDEEEVDSEESSDEEDDVIIPAYLVVNFYGVATLHQSEHEDWNTLGDELASWIGCKRVEVVRYTAPLNELTKKLRLNGRHLVFMVARNGYDGTVGDNMPATILYGGGYPLYGNIVFALETDKGYEIEGFMTKHLLNEAFEAINEAVGGLIRVEG